MSENKLVVESGEYSRVELSQKGEDLYFKPVGPINEDTNFEQAFMSISEVFGAPAHILIDTEGVGQINSVGIREWIFFINKLEAAYPIRFEKLSEIFVEQASLVPNMLGKEGTEVREFSLPYICEKCGNRVERMSTKADLKTSGGKIVVPNCGCDRCESENPMVLDALPEEYLSFLRRVKLI